MKMTPELVDLPPGTSPPSKLDSEPFGVQPAGGKLPACVLGKKAA